MKHIFWSYNIFNTEFLVDLGEAGDEIQSLGSLDSKPTRNYKVVSKYITYRWPIGSQTDGPSKVTA